VQNYSARNKKKKVEKKYQSVWAPQWSLCAYLFGLSILLSDDCAVLQMKEWICGTGKKLIK